MRRLWWSAIALAAAAVAAIVAGVALAGTDPQPHQVATALVAGGTAVLGGATVGALLSWAQLHIDDERAAREHERTRATSLDLTLLTQRDLPGIDLSGADLAQRYLRGRDFSGATFGDADLTGADLRAADLTAADLTGARLVGADLTGADLTGADLTGADLTGAELEGADLTAARSDGTTTWPQRTTSGGPAPSGGPPGG